MCGSKSPKCIAKLILRISFGGALLLVGVTHLQNVGEFKGMVSGGLGPLAPLGNLWAYILPLLQIVGGGLIVAGKRADIAVWCAGIALASIIIGSLLRPIFGGIPLGDPMAMGAANNTFIWLIVYFLVVKSMCCGSCDSHGGQGAGGGAPDGSC